MDLPICHTKSLSSHHSLSTAASNHGALAPYGLCVPATAVLQSALQVFCGALARVAQFADVLRDSKEQLRQVTLRTPCLSLA